VARTRDARTRDALVEKQVRRASVEACGQRQGTEEHDVPGECVGGGAELDVKCLSVAFCMGVRDTCGLKPAATHLANDVAPTMACARLAETDELT